MSLSLNTSVDDLRSTLECHWCNGTLLPHRERIDQLLAEAEQRGRKTMAKVLRQYQRHCQRISELRLTPDLRWIPVTEKLPDPDIAVLIAYLADDEPMVWQGYHDGDEGWFTVEGLPAPGCTHWMDLPAHPEGRG
jgi:hypothetical protein